MSEPREVSEILRSIFVRIADKAASEYDERSIYEEINYITFGATFIGALLLLVIVWIAFELMARNENARNVYRQRLFHPKFVKATRDGTDHRDPPPDVRRWKSYLLGALSIPEDKLPGLMGPGAHLTYRLIRHCNYFGYVAMLYSTTVLIPLYVSQHFHRYKQNMDLVKMMSISFVSPYNPSHAWALVISSYLLVFYWLVVIYSEWQHVKAVRLSCEHDARSYDLQSVYSILVERAKNDKRMDLKAYLARLLGKDESEVAIVAPVVSTGKLRSLEYSRWWANVVPSFFFSSARPKATVLADLDDSIRIEREVLRNRVRLGDSVLMTSQAARADPSVRQDTIVTHEPIPETQADRSLSETTVQTTSSIAETLIRLINATHVPTYFVTLRSMRSRTVLAHTYKSQGDSFARITPAAPPPDLIWPNVTVERKVLSTRKTFVRFLLTVIGILYPYPLVWILRRVAEYHATNTEDASDDPDLFTRQWWLNVFKMFMPVVIQWALSHSLRFIFRWVSQHYERFKTYQDVARHVMHRVYVFQLLTIYAIVFGEMWIDLASLENGFTFFVESLYMRMRRLGKAIPPVAGYFCSSVIWALVTDICYSILKPLDALEVLFHKMRGRKSAWKRAERVQFFYTSTMILYLTLLNTMFTFSVMAPVVIFFCWIFFNVSHMWSTYTFIFLNNRNYEVGTEFSPVTYAAISTSLTLSQLCFFVVLWSSSSASFHKLLNPQIYAAFVLVVITVLFKYAVMGNFSLKANQYTSLTLSAEMDTIHKPEEISALFDPEYYFQPDAKADVNSSDVATVDDVFDNDEVQELEAAPEPEAEVTPLINKEQ